MSNQTRRSASGPSIIFTLALKEFRSLVFDPVMMAIIGFTFTVGLYSMATGATYELHHSPIVVVDQDHSPLTRQIAHAFYPPYFLAAREVSSSEMDRLLDHGQASFALVMPPDFERDVKARRRPEVQLNIDANNVLHAFIGEGYIKSIINRELSELLAHEPAEPLLPITLISRVRYNPNTNSVWFNSVMNLISNITVMTIVLVGAAFLREREHGTLEHLLVMPVSPFQIMTAKVWANSLVVLVVAMLAMKVVVQWVLKVPIAGSVGLFFLATALYLSSASSIGIYLATVARSMPQFALLILMIILPLVVLSGAVTPIESMPRPLQHLMQLAPTAHIVHLSQAVLYRRAGLSLVWPSLAAIAGLNLVVFLFAQRRFRIAVTETQL